MRATKAARPHNPELPTEIVESVIDIPWQIVDWSLNSGNTNKKGQLVQPINVIGFVSTARMLNKYFAQKYKWVVSMHSGLFGMRTECIIEHIKKHVVLGISIPVRDYSVMYGAVYRMCNSKVVDTKYLLDITLHAVFAKSALTVKDASIRLRFQRIVCHVFKYLDRMFNLHRTARRTLDSSLLW